MMYYVVFKGGIFPEGSLSSAFEDSAFLNVDTLYNDGEFIRAKFMEAVYNYLSVEVNRLRVFRKTYPWRENTKGIFQIDTIVSISKIN